VAPRPSPAAGEDRCPRCDAAFGCEIATGGCWCAQVALDDEQRAQLAAGYDGCLCPACLRELSTAT
jgi:hypothetical protein